jgi:hypothetical protein
MSAVSCTSASTRDGRRCDVDEAHRLRSRSNCRKKRAHHRRKRADTLVEVSSDFEMALDGVKACVEVVEQLARASLGVSVDEYIPLCRSIVGNGDGIRCIETPDKACNSSADDLLGFRMA